MNELGVLFGWNLCLSFFLAAVAWVLCRFDSVRKRPALCHGIWFLVLLKLVTPPIVPVPLPAVFLPRAEESAAVWRSENDLIAQQQIADNGSVSALSPVVLTEGRPAVLPFEPRPPAEIQITANRGWGISSRAMFLGLLGFSALVTCGLWIRSIRELYTIQQMVRGCRDHSDHLAQLVKEVCHGLNLRVVPKVYLIDWAITPLLWAGRCGPTIILPRQLLGSLEANQLRRVIGHELAHYARKDHWTNLFGFFVATLFWWNPVAWLARREMNQAAEACCDALALERFPGTRRSYAATLLQVVDFIHAASASKPVLSMNFGGNTAIRRRIQMIADSEVRSTLSKLGWLLLLMIIPAFFLVPSHARSPQGPAEAKALPGSNEPSPEVFLTAATGSPVNAIQNPPAKYYVAGTVVERETKKPVPQAELMFHLWGEPDREKSTRTVTTDDQGRVRFEVPMGNVHLGGPTLRPGFWLPPERDNVSLTVSPEKPEAVFQIEVERGLIWPVQVVVEKGTPENLSLIAGAMEIEDEGFRRQLRNSEPVTIPYRIAKSQIFLDKQGKGQLTQCGKSGKLWLQFVDLGPNVLAPIEGITGLAAELLVDPAFDSRKVKSVHPVAGTNRVELVDEKGAKAIVGHAKVTIENGQPLLTFHLGRKTRPRQEFHGHVTDSQGNPLAEVDVGVVVCSKFLRAYGTKLTKTDKYGRFHVEVAREHKEEPKAVSYFRVLLNKEGFAGFQSKEIPLPKETGNLIDVGSVVLSPGKTRSALIVDQQGKPMAGVIIDLIADDVQILSTWRTDTQGRVVLRDLPTGPIHADLRYFDQHDRFEFNMSSLDFENAELKVTMKGP